jgi:hypothetical protein
MCMGEEGLTLALKNIFISSDTGYAAVGCDIGGGGYSGTHDHEKILFVRWAELGSLLPIMENGGRYNSQHQPWFFDKNTIDIYRYFAKLHHQLVPYFYSYDIQAHSDGISIIRPIGDRSEWEDKGWEYLLGDNFLVSAIYQKHTLNYTSKTINFPPGKWINYWNEDEIHEGETPANLNYNLDQYPIFIRSGAIIPMQVDDSLTGHGSSSSEKYLTLLIYPDGVSSYDYHSDPLTTTRITSDEQCGRVIISFNRNTNSVIIRLKNEVEPETVFLSGNLNLPKKNSFAQFEVDPSGWFHGKLNDTSNVYTWIKFSESSDSVIIATNSVSDINPPTYKLSSLNPGNKYYIDRPYTLINIPDEYLGYTMIRTANDDKNKDIDFHFNICSDADIYIAFDPRIPSPAWLTSNFKKTNEVIITTDAYFDTFFIWKGTALEGRVNLGDNGNTGCSMYFVFYKSNERTNPLLNLKLFLQGPYNAVTDQMSTNINSILPTTSPYTEDPVSVPYTIPGNITDWVLLQLRSTTDGSSTFLLKSCFLRNDGQLIDPDGLTENIALGVNPGSYYIVIKHRNHLAVMSNDLVELDGITTYNFTTGSGQFYGGSAGAVQINSSPIEWGMITGDGNGNGSITASDNNSVWLPQFLAGQDGYKSGDYNLNGSVTASDNNSGWLPNNGKDSQVPN